MFCVMWILLPGEVSANPVNLDAQVFDLEPVQPSSLGDRGIGPLAYQLGHTDGTSSSAARYLTRLIKQAAALANINSRPLSRDYAVSRDLDQTRGEMAEELMENRDIAGKVLDPSEKRSAGDRKCLYHAVNCW